MLTLAVAEGMEKLALEEPFSGTFYDFFTFEPYFVQGRPFKAARVSSFCETSRILSGLITIPACEGFLCRKAHPIPEKMDHGKLLCAAKSPEPT